MSLLNRIRFSRKNRNLSNRIRAAAPRTRLLLKALEERTVPATVTVTTLADNISAGDSFVTLREAIASLNAGNDLGDTDLSGKTTGTYGVADAVIFDGALFGSPQTMTMNGTEFAIMKSMSVTGPGSGLLTLDATSLSRHFNVSDDTISIIDVSLSGMTLTKGKAPTPPGGAPYASGSGGSIYVRNDRLTLDGMVITGNTAASNYNGGAISVGESATPQMFNSSGQGGALFINNSWIDSNVATGLGANGGAIHFSFPNSGGGFPGAYGNIFAITNSSVTNNQAGKRGGGIYFSGNASVQNSSSFFMRNTTVSSNKSLNEFAGGVIISSTTSLPMSIFNSTITNNTGTTSPGGGGLVLNTGTGTLNIESSIIADNSGASGNVDFFTNTGATINSRNNIIGSKVGINPATIFNDQGGNYYGSAKLVALASNGGIGATHLPAYNSPALNGGSFTATNLTVAMTAADTTATVASAAGLAIGNLIRIESEVLQITNIVGLVLTVSRGQNNSTAAAHASGLAVNLGATAATTLSAAATNVATSVTVASASGLSVGSFINVGAEILQITAIAGTTLTVVRGQYSTTATAHLIGAGVNLASTPQTLVSQAATVGIGDATIGVANGFGVNPGVSYQIDSEIVKVTQVNSVALTTIAAPMATSGGSVLVASTASLAAGMYTKIDNEIVLVTAIANISTTLAAPITSVAAPSCVVTSATGIVTGMFLLIDSEYVLVNGVIGTTLNISRGQNGSTAATHAAAAPVTSGTLTVTRGQLGTTSAAHVSGSAVNQSRLTVLRGQGSTVAATHNTGRSVMMAYDARGQERRQSVSLDIGATEVNPVTPAAVATVSNVTVGGGSSHTFTVTFTALNNIDATTVDLNNNAVRVTGPGGFDVPATFVSIDINTDGTPRTATYSFAAPGTWDYTDNGQYKINIQQNQIFDKAGTPVAVPAATVGTFSAAIGRNLLVINNFDSGPDSLRDAIDKANMNGLVVDTITFDTVQMLMPINGGSTTIIAASTLYITDPITITGSSGVVIDGASSVRIFEVNGPGNMAVTMSDLTLSNGKIPGLITDPNIGGAILAWDELLTLNNCVLTGNTGGAVALYSVITTGAMTIVGSTISNNTGGGLISATSPFGGGHDVSIQNSSIINNTGSGFSGRTFSFNMANSTIAGNSGATVGGGISLIGNWNSKGNSIINSTITGNSAANSGGGLYVYWSGTNSTGQRVLIANTTIAGNFSDGGFQNKPGGGVDNRTTTAYLVDFENSVIAGNTNKTVPDFNSKSTVLMNNSLVGIFQAANAKIIGVNNKLGSKSTPVDAQLAPLASNGGSTQTRLPYAGSPLVDYSLATPSLSTLTYGMSAAATSFFVAKQSDLANFPVNNYIMIDAEIMRVLGTSMASTTQSTVAIDSVVTTVNVANPANIAVGMNLTIETEVITVSAINSVSTTTLTAALTSGGTTATVASAAGISTGMYFLIDAEYVRVTAIAGLNLTIARAQNGTTAAAHAIAATLFTPTATVLRGQLGTTAAAHAANLFMNAPNVSVNSFILGLQRGLLGTTIAAHNTLGTVVTLGYTQPGNEQRGAGYPRTVNGKVDIGATEVDPNIPSAVLTPAIPPIVAATPNPLQFTVTFADNVSIDVASIIGNNNAIRVTGPSYNQLATYVGIDFNTNGTPRTATYQVSAPLVGGWTVADNGTYTVSMELNQVWDGTTYVQAHALGTFRVALQLNLVVTNDNDTGPGSLRNAVEQTNLNADVADVITFDPIFFNTPRTILLNSGDLYISDAVTITGPGASFATVKGVSSRIFSIDTPAVQQPVSISNLTMTGGNGSGSITFFGFEGGGAIINYDEALTINNCVIANNDHSGTTSSSAYGGAILINNSLATLVVTNTSITGNTAKQAGGGIALRYGNTSMTISNSVISNNVVLSTGGAGGGIDGTWSTGPGIGGSTITIDNSTIAYNTAVSAGGISMGSGIGSSTSGLIPAKLVINNSTLTGNLATSGNGGAIQLATGTYLTIRGTTITGNTARASGGGLQMAATFSNGGSLLYGPNYAIINSIIAGNKAKVTPDIGGGSTTTTLTIPVINSFIGVVDLSVQKLNNIGSIMGTLASPANPMLSPPAYNGGLSGMLTVMPKPGSPVINMGSATVPAVPVMTLTSAATAGATTIAVNANGPFVGGTPSGTMVIDAGLATEETIQWKSHSTLTITLQSALLFNHAINAVISRPAQPATPANDQRGVGYTRVDTVSGLLDAGAVEVDPTIPAAQGTFPTITAPTVGAQTITITYTDDVGLSMGTIVGNNNAIRITGPGGFNVLATYVSATPGTGSTVETVTYSFNPPGAGWDDGENGLYTVSVETGQIGDGTKFVTPSSLGNLTVAIAKTYVVDTIDDVDDLNYGPLNLSIREAIKLANASVGATDTITFSPTVFATPQTIQLGSGELVVTDPVQIIGPGKANVTIDALTASRIMSVDMTPAYWGSPVSISGMTLANGRNAPSLTGYAAGITTVTGALTIDNCEIYNMSVNGSGGAIAVNSFWGSLTLKNSYIHHNTASSGAGVYIGNNGSGLSTVANTVPVSIDNTIFDLNVGGSNGALAVLGGSSVTVNKSTFTNNVVSAFTANGGAIFVNAGTLNLQNSTVSNNFSASTSNTGTANAGGIYFGNNAVGILTNNTISGNSAAATGSGGNGGGIHVNSVANVTINGGVISNNLGNSTSTTGGGGGGLSLAGNATVTINNATITNNSALHLGGGILLAAGSTSATASGTLIINNSTISGNTGGLFASAGTGGGGLAITGTGGMTLITNSTITGNSSGVHGGGILAGSGTALGTTGLGGSVTIRNSTIAFNTAANNGGGIAFNNLPTGTTTTTLNLLSSIVSDNTSAAGSDVMNGVVTATAGRFNINLGTNTLLKTAVATLTAGTVAGTPIISATANLGGLASNGGATQTHSLLAGSAAINAGTNATDVLTTVGGAGMTAVDTTMTVASSALLNVGQRIMVDSEVMTISAIAGTVITVNRGQAGTVAAVHSIGANVTFTTLLGSFDQRGNSRSNGVTDIGAYEVQAPAKFSSVVINNGNSQRSMVTTVTVNFNQHIGFTGTPASAFTLNRVSDSASVTLNAVVDETGPGTAVTLTFTGGAVDLAGSLQDGRYNLKILASGFNAEGFDGDLDGIASGSPTDDYTFGHAGDLPIPLDTTKIFRIFGDYNGDGATANNDFNVFKTSFGGTEFAFDFNGDGAVANSDFNQFKTRFGGSI